MSDEELELRKRLAPGPPARPPEGLLEKLKADIPERLPANVRPLRPAFFATLVRIAAAVFVVGGAVFVVSHLPRETQELRETHETPPVLAPPPEEKPAAPPHAVEEVSPPERTQEKRKALARSEEQPPAPREVEAPQATGAFAPAMPPAPAAPAPPAAAPVEQAPEAGLAPSRRDAEVSGTAAQDVSPRVQESSSAPRDRAEKIARRPAAAARAAAAPAEPAPSARRVVPTAGSLLAEVFDRLTPPAAARDGENTLVLLSAARGEEAELSGEAPLEVLSAAVLPRGGVVVLARTRGEAAGATLRAGEEGASITRVAPSIAAAGADLRVAVLAWRLERALASGDREERFSVAREAASLARVAPRAEVLVRLASR